MDKANEDKLRAGWRTRIATFEASQQESFLTDRVRGVEDLIDDILQQRSSPRTAEALASIAGVREQAFAEAAKHLEDHAVGYENSAKGIPREHREYVHEGTFEWRRRDEAIANNLREKAAQIRLMK